MEWWILFGLALVLCGLGVVGRRRSSRRRPSDGEANNIYPLW